MYSKGTNGTYLMVHAGNCWQRSAFFRCFFAVFRLLLGNARVWGAQFFSVSCRFHCFCCFSFFLRVPLRALPSTARLHKHCYPEMVPRAHPTSRESQTSPDQPLSKREHLPVAKEQKLFEVVIRNAMGVGLLRGEQRAPENATHLKMQASGRSRNLRFRVVLRFRVLFVPL